MSKKENQKRALTGIRPSGAIHIGNYLGMIKPALELQEDYQCLYFLADQHSLTTMRDPAELRSNILDQAATWIAVGLDYQKNIIYKQSDMPNTELAWYLACHTGVGFLEKAHAYKDAKAKNKELNSGIMFYPILMAADILLYDTDLVPVGKDQKQHVEMARDMAGTINSLYGANTLKLPESKIKADVMTIPGLDGQKMSKSYNNTIPLMLPEKQLRKKVMSLITDSSDLEAKKSLENTALGGLFKLFADDDEYQDLEARLNAGGLGWGHAKDELFEAINREISPYRERYQELRADETFLNKVLADGAERAQEIVSPIMARVRKAIGL